jgi:hypothetical protein
MSRTGMKRSSPLIILVALTLAALSYGGKRAETPSQPRLKTDRGPASVPTSVNEKPPVLNAQKSTQDPVVIAEFPPLEIEEIH